MVQFFETRMGQKFYTSDVPRIATALEKIAKSLENHEKPTDPMLMPKQTVEDPDKISIIWGVDDVLQAAINVNVQINKDEAREILQTIKRRHDAEQGVNWDTLAINVEMFDQERKEK